MQKVGYNQTKPDNRVSLLWWGASLSYLLDDNSKNEMKRNEIIRVCVNVIISTIKKDIKNESL